MKVGSLFTGIGGADIGFERAGATIEWQCEIDKHASSVLARHWPGVPNHGDVTMIGAHVGKVDLICGGFPCQDVSVAGRRAGLAGERSGLWFEFHRIARELRPEWLLIENVPGLLSSHQGADFAVILQGLAELGYGVAWRVLDAQYFGLAQRRKRVFIVGHLGDGRAAEVLFEREGVRWDPPARRAAWQDIAGTLGGSSQSGGGGSSVSQIVFDPTQVTSPGNYSNPKPGDPCHPLAAGAYVPLIIGALSDGAHHGGGLNGQDAYSGRIIAPVGLVRRLTPTECERLQGFPDGWTDVPSTIQRKAGPVVKPAADSHRYRQLGNAVAVPVAEWLAKRIMAVS